MVIERDEHDDIIEPEMENLDDFLKSENIKIHVLLAHENPYRPSSEIALHWSCKLINNENQYTVIYFSKGLGIRLWIEPPQTDSGLPLHVPKDKIGKRYDGPMPPFEKDKEAEIFNKCSAPEIPHVKEVMLCLAVDMRNLENTASFERWTKLMDTTPDSMVAKTTFDLLMNQRTKLIQLLGEEPYHRMTHEIELN